MNDKPLDCVGVTNGLGKSDFRERPLPPVIQKTDNPQHRAAVKTQKSASINGESVGYSDSGRTTARPNVAMTGRISDIALQAARDYVAENAENGDVILNCSNCFVINVTNPKAFMAAIGHAVLASRAAQNSPAPS